jgi:hypothetical protein
VTGDGAMVIDPTAGGSSSSSSGITVMTTVAGSSPSARTVTRAIPAEPATASTTGPVDGASAITCGASLCQAYSTGTHSGMFMPLSSSVSVARRV